LPGQHWWGVVVGVGQYPKLDPALSLDGPPNDVPLVIDWLVHQGVPRAHLTVLADRVPHGDGLPTRAAIMTALEELGRRAQSGDFAFIYLAGHGSQQPQGGANWSKSDGMSEIFLPRDVGRWDEATGVVRGAIADIEVARVVGALRARGVFVWVVVDSCHSASLARAVARPHVRIRSISADQLGVPDAPGRILERASDRLIRLQGGKPGTGYVAFYAAQTVDSAPELPLPAGDPKRRVHGLFTYTLLRSLAAGAASYRELTHRILSVYSATYPTTTPEFEGELDAPVGVPGAEFIAPSTWPARNMGRTFKIDAGRLNGVTADSLLELYSAVPTGTELPLGILTVTEASLTEATASAIREPARLAVFNLSSDRSDTVASGVIRILRTGVDTTVRVVPPGSCIAAHACARSPQPQQSDEVSRARNLVLEAGRSLPGIEFTQDLDAADLFLQVRNGGLSLQRSLHAGEADAAVSLAEPTASTELRQVLVMAARAVALERVAGEFPEADNALSAEVRLRVPNAGWQTLRNAPISTVPFGSELSIQIQNVSNRDLDVTVFALDDHFAIEPVYPIDRQSNLLRKGSSRLEMSGWARTLGDNELVFIVEDAQAGRPHDLSYLAQPGITRGAADSEDFVAMLERIGFTARGTRSSLSVEAARRTSMKVLRYRVIGGN
jgi:hypothetical protein